MAATLDRLRREHRNSVSLLDILEAEMAAFNHTGRPDYDIMAAIADYFLGYPKACHHPKEDLVYEALMAKRPDCTAAIGNIVAEHRAIAELARLFGEAVTNVMHDAEVSRTTFGHVVSAFVAAQRQHIEKEEAGLFPLAADILTEADWTAIDARIADADDPLFGAMPEKRFAALRRDIEEWERARFT